MKEEKLKRYQLQASCWVAFEWLFYSMSLYFRDLKYFARSFEHFITRGLTCFQLPSSALMMKTFYPGPYPHTGLWMAFLLYVFNAVSRPLAANFGNFIERLKKNYISNFNGNTEKNPWSDFCFCGSNESVWSRFRIHPKKTQFRTWHVVACEERERRLGTNLVFFTVFRGFPTIDGRQEKKVGLQSIAFCA